MSDKNNSVDSEKIKQLLAQLRAKFDMEGTVAPVDSVNEEEGEEDYQAEETTISFAIPQSEEIEEEPEAAAVVPLRELSKTFGAFHEQLDKNEGAKLVEAPALSTLNGDGCGDETLAFLLDRYAIAPSPKKPAAPAAEPVAPKKPQTQPTVVEEKKEVPFVFPSVDEEDEGAQSALSAVEEEAEENPFVIDEVEAEADETEIEVETEADEAEIEVEAETEAEMEVDVEIVFESEADGNGEATKEAVSTAPEFPDTAHGEYVQERLDITAALPIPSVKEEEKEEVASLSDEGFIPMFSFDDEPEAPACEVSLAESEPTEDEKEEAPIFEAPEEVPVAPEAAFAEEEAVADADEGDMGEERPGTVLFPIGEGRPAPKEEPSALSESDESSPEQRDDTDYGIPLDIASFSMPQGSEEKKEDKPTEAPASAPDLKSKEEEAPVAAPASPEASAPALPKETANEKKPAPEKPAKRADTKNEEKPAASFFDEADGRRPRARDAENGHRKKMRGVGSEYTSRTQAERIRRALSGEIKWAKCRLVLAILFAFALLYLENVAVVGAAPAFLTGSADIVSAVLLAAVLGLCAKELISGVVAFFYHRVLPLGIISIASFLALVYTVLVAALGGSGFVLAGAPRVSFAVALSCVLFLYWETVRYENRFSSFTVLSKAGDKLVFSLASPKDSLTETNVLGKSLNEEIPYIYRVRKTGFVDEFSARTGRVCENSRQNFWMLVISFAASAVALIAALIMKHSFMEAFGWMLTVLFFSLPVSMCATHVYPMARALYVAGESSTILGEASVNECAGLDAVEFEDIEAIPSRKVDVKNVKMYVGDVALVFYCLSSLFHLVGGPICGFFNKSTKELGHTGSVTLKESVAGGLAATVDKFQVLVGDGEYMQSNGVKLFYDAEDERWIEKGVCIMFAAINHKLCAKFYVQYTMDPAFEHNVMRLSRAGIATIIRTYDPNITNRLLQRISALGDCRVHVVTKTVEQYNDFAAPHLTGGIVTTEDSGKLLQLLFLSLRTRGVIAFSRLLKSVSLFFGVLLGLLSFFVLPLVAVPSAILGLHHLIWLFIAVAFTRFRIRRPKTKRPRAANGEREAKKQ